MSMKKSQVFIYVFIFIFIISPTLFEYIKIFKCAFFPSAPEDGRNKKAISENNTYSTVDVRIKRELRRM